MEDIEKYGLDLHSNLIVEDYRSLVPVFSRMKTFVLEKISSRLESAGIQVTGVEARVKTEKSLVGKLELKGSKYASIDDLTDIVGVRIITFFTDDVDRISALIEKTFEVDWQNSVDKRKMHELDSFGYMSLHFICRIPEELYFDPECPDLNRFRFEVQMRTALQHVWANMNHDTGYKSGIEVPKEYIRSLSRLAGLLELADDEFSRIRSSIADYRRKVEVLVADGKFEEVPLNGDTFRSFLTVGPFDKLTRRIAGINHAEIHETSAMPYLRIFSLMGFKTLGDIRNLIVECSEDAYQLALSQICGTDIDIISSTVGIQDLCVVYVLRNGGGQRGLEHFFNELNGPSPYNEDRAARIIKQASQLAFMNIMTNG